MDRRTYLRGVGAGVAVLAGCASRESERTDAESTANRSTSAGTSGPATASGVHRDYETTTVRALTPDRESLGEVTAAIADTPELRYRGLSETETLPVDRGMLFVFDAVADRSFVMRRMDFGIDIVYADGEKTITAIRHAPVPAPEEDGSDQRYPGRGQYVLEVAYGWTTDRGVEAGDRLAFEL
ncbi:putative membrane protein [Halapricum desulfuricans]|uniref:Putative membrane protein n=1 Tax=Halapricum desulfuricans TaxID=2841257 RepID=A0A897NI78_9EURY|nr:DUF192 domain-containing protein [Halapricum desulfuricans]QSG10673.1 putative membrane protein [Halapricum desulfuricans]